MKRIGLALTILLLASVPGRSQESPSQVAQRYFDAVARQQWDAAVALADPAAVRRFRNFALSTFVVVASRHDELERELKPQTGNGALFPLRIDSVARPSDLERVGAWRIPAYPGSPTVGELAAMTPQELFARSYPISEIECFDGECRPLRRHPRYIVVASAIENDSVAHALYRQDPADTTHGRSGDEGDPWGVEVLHLFRRAGSPWRVGLPAYSAMPSVFLLMDKRMGMKPPPP
jgi:hypothetical protein